MKNNKTLDLNNQAYTKSLLVLRTAHKVKHRMKAKCTSCGELYYVLVGSGYLPPIITVLPVQQILNRHWFWWMITQVFVFSTQLFVALSIVVLHWMLVEQNKIWIFIRTSPGSHKVYSQGISQRKGFNRCQRHSYLCGIWSDLWSTRSSQSWGSRPCQPQDSQHRLYPEAGVAVLSVFQACCFPAITRV